MVAYSFKARFAEPILAGTKRQTIRADRRRHARPGETLQLFTGMRTKHCRKIMDVRCVSVEPIEMFVDSFSVYPPRDDGDPTAFAIADGFASLADMHGFWLHEHGPGKFVGVIIRWEPLS